MRESEIRMKTAKDRGPREINRNAHTYYRPICCMKTQLYLGDGSARETQRVHTYSEFYAQFYAIDSVFCTLNCAGWEVGMNYMAKFTGPEGFLAGGSAEHQNAEV